MANWNCPLDYWSPAGDVWPSFLQAIALDADVSTKPFEMYIATRSESGEVNWEWTNDYSVFPWQDIKCIKCYTEPNLVTGSFLWVIAGEFRLDEFMDQFRVDANCVPSADQSRGDQCQFSGPRRIAKQYFSYANDNVRNPWAMNPYECADRSGRRHGKGKLGQGSNQGHASWWEPYNHVEKRADAAPPNVFDAWHKRWPDSLSTRGGNSCTTGSRFQSYNGMTPWSYDVSCAAMEKGYRAVDWQGRVRGTWMLGIGETDALYDDLPIYKDDYHVTSLSQIALGYDDQSTIPPEATDMIMSVRSFTDCVELCFEHDCTGLYTWNVGSSFVTGSEIPITFPLRPYFDQAWSIGCRIYFGSKIEITVSGSVVDSLDNWCVTRCDEAVCDDPECANMMWDDAEAVSKFDSTDKSNWGTTTFGYAIFDYNERVNTRTLEECHTANLEAAGMSTDEDGYWIHESESNWGWSEWCHHEELGSCPAGKAIYTLFGGGIDDCTCQWNLGFIHSSKEVSSVCEEVPVNMYVEADWADSRWDEMKKEAWRVYTAGGQAPQSAQSEWHDPIVVTSESLKLCSDGLVAWSGTGQEAQCHCPIRGYYYDNNQCLDCLPTFQSDGMTWCDSYDWNGFRLGPNNCRTINLNLTFVGGENEWIEASTSRFGFDPTTVCDCGGGSLKISQFELKCHMCKPGFMKNELSCLKGCEGPEVFTYWMQTNAECFCIPGYIGSGSSCLRCDALGFDAECGGYALHIKGKQELNHRDPIPHEGRYVVYLNAESQKYSDPRTFCLSSEDKINVDSYGRMFETTKCPNSRACRDYGVRAADKQCGEGYTGLGCQQCTYTSSMRRAPAVGPSEAFGSQVFGCKAHGWYLSVVGVQIIVLPSLFGCLGVLAALRRWRTPVTLYVIVIRYTILCSTLGLTSSLFSADTLTEFLLFIGRRYVDIPGGIAGAQIDIKGFDPVLDLVYDRTRPFAIAQVVKILIMSWLVTPVLAASGVSAITTIKLLWNKTRIPESALQVAASIDVMANCLETNPELDSLMRDHKGIPESEKYSNTFSVGLLNPILYEYHKARTLLAAGHLHAQMILISEEIKLNASTAWSRFVVVFIASAIFCIPCAQIVLSQFSDLGDCLIMDEKTALLFPRGTTLSSAYYLNINCATMRKYLIPHIHYLQISILCHMLIVLVLMVYINIFAGSPTETLWRGFVRTMEGQNLEVTSKTLQKTLETSRSYISVSFWICSPFFCGWLQRRSSTAFQLILLVYFLLMDLPRLFNGLRYNTGHFSDLPFVRISEGLMTLLCLVNMSVNIGTVPRELAQRFFQVLTIIRMFGILAHFSSMIGEGQGVLNWKLGPPRSSICSRIKSYFCKSVLSSEKIKIDIVRPNQTCAYLRGILHGHPALISGIHHLFVRLYLRGSLTVPTSTLELVLTRMVILQLMRISSSNLDQRLLDEPGPDITLFHKLQDRYSLNSETSPLLTADCDRPNYPFSGILKQLSVELDSILNSLSHNNSELIESIMKRKSCLPSYFEDAEMWEVVTRKIVPKWFFCEPSSLIWKRMRLLDAAMQVQSDRLFDEIRAPVSLSSFPTNLIPTALRSLAMLDPEIFTRALQGADSVLTFEGEHLTAGSFNRAFSHAKELCDKSKNQLGSRRLVPTADRMATVNEVVKLRFLVDIKKTLYEYSLRRVYLDLVNAEGLESDIRKTLQLGMMSELSEINNSTHHIAKGNIEPGALLQRIIELAQLGEIQSGARRRDTGDQDWKRPTTKDDPIPHQVEAVQAILLSSSETVERESTPIMSSSTTRTLTSSDVDDGYRDAEEDGDEDWRIV